LLHHLIQNIFVDILALLIAKAPRQQLEALFVEGKSIELLLLIRVLGLVRMVDRVFTKSRVLGIIAGFLNAEVKLTV
jgi:hypothetical protein